ncbi:MAG TPA: hypothetical protein VJ242_01480 [Patescibacteria group bacterium]|nr:hypothetical protein [Patescibacteria group bacterium]
MSQAKAEADEQMGKKMAAATGELEAQEKAIISGQIKKLKRIK